MAVVNWTIQAVEDIETIASFIAMDSFQYAQIQVSRFLEAVKVLEGHPEFGKPVPEANNTQIREIVVGSYRIIYWLKNDETIDILTIHHSRRLLDKSQFSTFQ